jgi:hypothetical protein
MDNTNVWRLRIEIHKGTINSRDSASHSSKYGDPKNPLTSLEDCVDTAQKWEESYRSQGFGYKIYIADAIAPDGTVYRSIIPVAPAP